jgi:lipopolysaccharide export LptBFGC system permease protein LptF
VLLPVYLFGLLVAGVLVLFEERIVPYAIRENELVDRLVREKGKVEVGRVPHLSDGSNRWSAVRWYPREERLAGLACQRFVDPSGELPSGTLEAAELVYRRHPKTGRVGWFPKGGILTPAAQGAAGRPATTLRLPPDEPIPFGFTPDDVDVFATRGQEGIGRAQLVELQQRFPREHKWSVDLHTRTTRPAASFVLLLLGIPFVASPEKRSIAWGLGLALLLCVAYFGADFLCREIGMRGDVNPVVAVWIPPILFTSVALSIMDRATT